MLKKTYPIISLFALTILLCSWGSKGHYAINYKCTASFPSTMTGFGVWADSLRMHASDADIRKSDDRNEAPRHYIDIDNYSEFVSRGRIASTYDSIVAIHGAPWVIDNGTLPWATRNTYDSLKVAFRKRQWHKAMLLASDLGHYVGDGHMPLHLTSNYDGGTTNQDGIHSRYETTLVAAYINTLSNYSGSPVSFVSNVNKYVLDYIYTNQRYVDSVLIADTYATNLTGGTSSTQYTQALWSKTQFTTSLFCKASHALAELIYSAWVEAGSPAFGSKASTTNAQPLNINSIISIYPNPTKGVITINVDKIEKTDVCDINGKFLATYYTKTIDLSDFKNGVYILNSYSNGVSSRNRILVVK